MTHDTPERGSDPLVPATAAHEAAGATGATETADSLEQITELERRLRDAAPGETPQVDDLIAALPPERDRDPAPAAAPAPVRASAWRVVAWGLWDWGSAAFAAVVTTFVVSTWLTTSGAFAPTDVVAAVAAEEAAGTVDGPAALELAGITAQYSTWLGWGLAIAGVAVALVAPILGNRSDRQGRRRFWLAVFTGLVIACTAAVFFVRPDQDALVLNLVVGIALLSLGNVFFEFASVNYNASLAQVAGDRSLGRVSGFGWGMGYLGGIVLLLILYVGFISPDVGWFGVTGEDGMAVRVSALLAAAWFLLFALPVFWAVPEVSINPRRHRLGLGETVQAAGGNPVKAAAFGLAAFFASYPKLFRDLLRLRRTHPEAVRFVIASAVFRDGLVGVFVFGAVIGTGSFGLDATDVLLFAIAANVTAGIATILAGFLDDWIGPRAVIIGSLIGLVLSAVGLLVLNQGGPTVFWALGLALSLFVGPAQASSRSYLARLVPEGREGEVFGLFATTGRAVSFLTPTMFAGAITLSALVTGQAQQFWGIGGIGLVLLVGLLLVLPRRVSRPAPTGS